MYTSALKTLTQIKLEILAGLCYEDLLLTNLWTLLQSLGPYCGQKPFIDLLVTNPKARTYELDDCYRDSCNVFLPFSCSEMIKNITVGIQVQ